jgi:ubiquinone/menaquinone biosynthesis C-methylase UbiE
VVIEEARERSREGHPAVEFRQADAHAFPLADATFDACRVERTLQHVADPRRVVAEMVRVAKPGARIVAMEPDWGTIFVEGGGREATSALIRARADLITRHGWIGRALPGLLREAGLERVTPFAEVFQLTDLALARYLISFDESAEAAQAAGWLRPADYAAWLGALEAASARGTFFAGLVAFIVAGTKRSPTIG